MARAVRGAGRLAPNVAITVDRTAEVAAGVAKLTESVVMVGVPEEKTRRKDDARITNAALAYIHSNGAPEARIPARPFLQPGIVRAKERILDWMKQAADAALAGRGAGTVEVYLARAGQEAVNSAQKVIREGIPPPLKDSTVKRRRVRTPGSKYRRKAENPDETTPLWDTGQLLRSITFIIRKVRR